MDKVTNEIVPIRTEVRERNLETLVRECQQSGLTVRQWYGQNGINPSTYYARLRKLREKECREIVPIESPAEPKQTFEIKITFGEIVVSLSKYVGCKTLTMILRVLKLCLEN